MDRLNYFRHNQKKMRADKYQNIRDRILSDDCDGPSAIGKKVILPSSFTGGPRHMEQLFQDAMACMRVHGKPDLFITFTANPKWPEILCELKEGQEPNDRPDLITRVFKLKLKALLDDLFKNKIFGLVTAHIYVIEWQKRGLPHAHILIVLQESDKIRTVDQVDMVVNAEIPDKDSHKLAYETVTNCMMHGPCGVGFPKAACMKDGKCSKGFPKAFQEETVLANEK
jgi:hypothetical protein